MRICISIDDPSSEPFTMPEHFGARGNFVIYDTDKNTFYSHRCQPESCRGACHCQIPAMYPPTFDAVVCRNLGARAFKLLRRQNVEVFITNETQVDAAIELLEKRQLHAAERGICRPDVSSLSMEH